MNKDASGFSVKPIDYETGLPELRSVRETVFVQEQNVPLELEWDELDPQCIHVIARDAMGFNRYDLGLRRFEQRA